KYHSRGQISGGRAERTANRSQGDSDSRRSTAGRAAAMIHVVIAQVALVVLFVFVANAWYLYAVWLYAALTWAPLLSRLRFLVEHPGSDDRNVSTDSACYERLFFASFQFNYLFEHHVWPILPAYNLARMHRVLSEHGYFDRHPEYVGRSL